MSELKCMAAHDFEDLLQVQFVAISYVSVGLHYFSSVQFQFLQDFSLSPTTQLFASYYFFLYIGMAWQSCGCILMKFWRS